MRRFTAILIFLGVVCSAMAQINVAPGMRMPDVDADWVKPLRRVCPGKDSKIMDIVVFSDINTQENIQTLRYLESLESKFRRAYQGKWILKIRVVVPNDKATLDSFMKLSDPSYTIAIGADNNGRTYRNFVVTRVPEAVIGVNGAIAWIGPVMDLDSVVSAIMDGTFSLEEYRGISRMKMEMQTALRSGLPDVAAKTAEKILEKNPGDMTSIQTILYSYELKNQSGNAIRFLEDRIAKCGKKAGGLHLLLLDRIVRSGNLSLWQKAVDNAIKNCTTSDDKLNLAAFLLEMSPRFYFPAEQVPELCADILKMPGTSDDPEFHANAMEIAARAEFAVCRLDNAIALQKKTVELRKQQKSPFLKNSLRALEYYTKIKDLSVKK